MTGPIAQHHIASLTPLVGRAEDVQAVKERLGLSRLVTLTGPGGIGKTRLGLAVAQELNAPIVDLTSITDGDLIAPEITTALGLQPNLAVSPLEALANAIAGTERLILLDNVESVPAAGLSMTLQAILAHASGLRVLATGRAPVGITGEAEFQVHPLATPEGETAEALEESAAGSLLLQRARAIGAVTGITPAEAAALIAICRRLDGIPLALELAASQLRVRSATEIKDDLDRGMSLPSDPQRPERQRSLEATIDWSIDAVTAEQLRVLTTATAFAGGFSLPQLAEILPDLSVMPAINALVGMGLVRVSQATGARRFFLLETIRTMAAARLDSADTTALEKRHAAVFAAFVRRHGGQLDRPDTCSTDELFRDRDNIRVAFEWATKHDHDLALELVGRLGEYWFEVGGLDEGIDWADRALAHGAGSDTLRLHAEATRIHLKRMRSARGISEEAKSLWLRARSSTDPAAATRAMSLAAPAIHSDEVSPAEVLDEAHAVAEKANLRAWVPSLLIKMARWQQEDDLDTANSLLVQAAEMAHEVGDAHSEAVARGNLATTFEDSDVAQAIAQTRQALAVLGTAYPTIRAWLLSNLSGYLARIGDPGFGRAELIEAVQLTLAHPGIHLVEMAFANAPRVLLQNGQDDLAIRAFGFLKRLDEDRDVPLSGQELRSDEADRKDLHARVGEVRAHLLEAQGRSELPMPLLHEILSAMESEATIRTGSQRTRLRHGEFTRREVEVLELLASGMSDPDIGAALFISPSTASVHVSNIKAKLGVETRVEAALKARELGLGPPVN